jgi:hypothetical protein
MAKTDLATLDLDLKIGPGWQIILDCIDMFGAALADHGHQWTPDERRTYEDAVRVISRLVDAQVA